MTAPTLRIDNLKLGFKTYSGMIEVLHGISLHIKKGERVSQKVPTGNSDVDASLRTVIGAANEDQAKNKAEGASKSSDREKGAGSITIIGDILAEPEAICNVSGVRPGIDGGYRISSVTHSISKGSGFTSEISLREPQGGAGVDSR